MAITKSAKKALRQNTKRKVRNLRQRKNLKTLLKKVANLVNEKRTDEVKKLLPKVYKILDKAAKTGLIKKNTASRKKSRLSKSLFKSQQ